MTTTDELLPCPFCGGSGYIGHDLAEPYVEGIPKDPEGDLHISIADCGWYYVYCIGCDMKGPKVKGPVNWATNPESTKRGISSAIHAWNKRATIQERLVLE